MPLTKATLSNKKVLVELTQVLRSIPDITYGRKTLLNEEIPASSIGAHCRHIIEFYQGFIRGLSTGVIDYDSRARNSELESNRTLAIQQIEQISKELPVFIASFSSTAPLDLQAQIDTQQVIKTQTTITRELIFLQTHSVHHQAMIALLMICFGLPTPSGLGVAISTRINNKQQEPQAADL